MPVASTVEPDAGVALRCCRTTGQGRRLYFSPTRAPRALASKGSP